MSDAVGLLKASVGRAADALCAMANVDVELGEVGAHDDADEPLDGGASVAILLGITGGLTGSIVLVAPEPLRVAELIGVPAHLAESAVAELGNILGSHLVIGLEEAAGVPATILPPVVLPSGGAVVDVAPGVARVDLRCSWLVTLYVWFDGLPAESCSTTHEP
jgi:chemotaxis protein CheY-P-specific phosphatase CheC